MSKVIQKINFRISALEKSLLVVSVPQSVRNEWEARLDELLSLRECLLDEGVIE